MSKGTRRFPDGYLLKEYAAAVHSGGRGYLERAHIDLAENLLSAEALALIRQKIAARLGLKLRTRNKIPPELTSRPRRLTHT